MLSDLHRHVDGEHLIVHGAADCTRLSKPPILQRSQNIKNCALEAFFLDVANPLDGNLDVFELLSIEQMVHIALSQPL